LSKITLRGVTRRLPWALSDAGARLVSRMAITVSSFTAFSEIGFCADKSIGITSMKMCVDVDREEKRQSRESQSDGQRALA